MSIFIKITVTGDLSLLGRGNVEQAWENIYSEYCSISDNETSILGLKTAIDITYYTTKIKNIYYMVNYLRSRYVPELMQELCNMGFKVKEDTLQKDLDSVLSRTKTDEMQLRVAISKYEAMQKNDAAKATELDWYRRLAQIGKVNHQHYNPALISVLDFVALEKEFKMYIDAQRTGI